MKVYIVLGGYNYESSYILEVFSSRKAAEEYARLNITTNSMHREGKDYYDYIEIEEHEVK